MIMVIVMMKIVEMVVMITVNQSLGEGMELTGGFDHLFPTCLENFVIP